MITFTCRRCAAKLHGSEDRIGRTAKCPKCLQQIVLEAPQEPETHPPSFNGVKEISGEILKQSMTGKSEHVRRESGRKRDQQPWSLPFSGDRFAMSLLAIVLLLAAVLCMNATVAVVGVLVLICMQLSACVDCLTTLIWRHDEVDHAESAEA